MSEGPFRDHDGAREARIAALESEVAELRAAKPQPNATPSRENKRLRKEVERLKKENALLRAKPIAEKARILSPSNVILESLVAALLVIAMALGAYESCTHPEATMSEIGNRPGAGPQPATAFP